MLHAVPAATPIDTGLACLVLLARYFELPADIQQLSHTFAPPGKVATELELLQAAKSLGLKARAVTVSIDRIERLPLPAIASLGNGSFVVLAKAGDDKVLIHDPLLGRPQTLSVEEFCASGTCSLVLFTKRAKLLDAETRFGFRWFTNALLKYRALLGEVLLASFFLQLIGLVTPLFFQVVVDKVLVHKGMSTLDVLCIGLIVVSLFEVILAGLRTYVFSHTTNRVDVTLGAQLFSHLMRLPINYFSVRRVGDTVARVRELERIREFLTGSALTVVVDLFFTLVFIGVMFYYSPLLAGVVIASIPCYVILSVLVTPVLRERLDVKFARGAENQAFLVESVTGVETIKSLALEPQMQRRWEEQLAAYVSASFKTLTLGNTAQQTAGFINKLVTVASLWFGARLVMDNELTVGGLVAFNMMAGRVSGPILRLTQLWQDFQQAGLSVQRLGDILNMPREPGYNPNRASLPQVRGEVRLDKVCFRYQPDRPAILHDVEMTVRPGEIVGIVGRSGSGKSTLTKLVQRLYVPESGRVLIDGVDLALVEPAWLRRQIGVVLQENFLFNRTIRDNIAIAEPGMPMERVIHAAKLAGAHDFILELPEGYDSLVGEHGSNLSGGQRQRIAIARALVTNPRILIFDEATSALDYESERIIQQNMRAICHGRTVFIIAHRLTTVRDANRILVLERGSVVEQGTHQQLIQLDGHYAKLYALQVA